MQNLVVYKPSGREAQNCRHFWTRVWSSRFKSANCHRDRWGPGREPQNCHHFWTRVWSSRSKIPKVPTVTGIGGVLVANRRSVITFGLVFCLEREEERGEREREQRGEDRVDRIERREERERRGERREERREKREERREEIHEERGEKKEESGEETG